MRKFALVILLFACFCFAPHVSASDLSFPLPMQANPADYPIPPVQYDGATLKHYYVLDFGEEVENCRYMIAYVAFNYGMTGAVCNQTDCAFQSGISDSIYYFSHVVWSYNGLDEYSNVFNWPIHQYDSLWGIQMAHLVYATFPFYQPDGTTVFREADVRTLTVQIDPEAGGNVTGDYGVSCNVETCSNCQYMVPLNAEFSLTANPADCNWSFVRWEWNDGANSSTNNPETFEMDAAMTVKAVFKPIFTFPLAGYDPTTVPISAVMDHSVFDHSPVQFYQTDDVIKTFNGEIGEKQYGYSYASGVWGYKKEDSGDFLVGYNYTEPKEYIFYDGHAGYDFAVSNGTNVLAPFDGKLYWPTADLVNGNVATFGTFFIDHENGYSSWFLHCSGLTQDVADEVQQNGFAVVYKGQHVAESGNRGTSGYHLHYEVRKGGVDDEHIIDPYKAGLWE